MVTQFGRIGTMVRQPSQKKLESAAILLFLPLVQWACSSAAVSFNFFSKLYSGVHLRISLSEVISSQTPATAAPRILARRLLLPIRSYNYRLPVCPTSPRFPVAGKLWECDG
jgi:CRISPR/Cas system endoribonuclease Cas6 (RAMP superfamily)